MISEKAMSIDEAGGYFRIYRKLFDSDIWRGDPLLLKVWIWILGQAAWKDHTVPVGINPITLKAGQFITGRLKASKTLNCSEREFRSRLNYLKSTSRIAIETTNKFSIITVSNWALYQSRKDSNDQQNDRPNDQQTTNKRPTNDQQATTAEEGKEGLKGEEGKENKEHLVADKSGDGVAAKKKRGRPPKPTDPRIKKFIDWFCVQYEKEFGRKYVVCGGKDGAAVKGLFQSLEKEGVDYRKVLIDATQAMFADKFWREKSGIAILRSQINVFRSAGTPPKPKGDAGGWLTPEQMDAIDKENEKKDKVFYEQRRIASAEKP